MNWASRKNTLKIHTIYIFLEDNSFILLWNIHTVSDIKYEGNAISKLQIVI